MDALMARQPQSVKSDRLGPSGDFQPLANLEDPRDKSSKTSSAQSQVKQIFDKAKTMPSSIEDWNSIKPIADAMHAALSGLGSGDFLDQLKKIKSQAQFSALIKNWVFDGQTLYQWLEEEYTIEWQEILDIIKPLQNAIGKYTRGWFDDTYDQLKNKGWKITTANVLDADFMYKGLWIIRRNSARITYGNESTGQVQFFIKDYDSLIHNIVTPMFETLRVEGQLGNDFDSNEIFKVTKTFKEWEQILAKQRDVYIYFLSKKYKRIVERHFHKLLSKTYDNARTWWIDKLLDPAFARIYSRVNGINRKETKKIIQEYKRIISSIPIKTQFFGEPADYSGVFRPSEGIIQIVCDRFKYYLRDSALSGHISNNPTSLVLTTYSKVLTDLMSTTVHELQHSIWNHKPLNKRKTWEQIQPYDVNVGAVSERLWYKVFGANAAALLPNEKQLSTISSLYRIPKTTLDDWVNDTKNVKASDGFYPCDIDEHQARLTQYKLENRLSTSTPIRTTDMIAAIQYGPKDIQTTNLHMWYYIIICWTRNSMTDINDFVGWLNAKLIAKQDKKRSGKGTRTDFTQTA
jgi:hypothetical protein